jgi:hypothetical protein
VSDKISVTLPNGAVIREIPRETSPEEIKRVAIMQGLASEEDFSAPAEPATPTVEAPEQTAILDEQPPEVAISTRMAAGAEQGLGNIGRGIQRIYGMNPSQDPQEQERYRELKERYPLSVGGSEIAAEALPFAVPAVGADLLLTRIGAGLATRLGAQAGIGGTEGGVIASGKGLNVATGIAVGAGTASLGELAAPFVARAFRSLVREVKGWFPKKPVIDEAGNLSDEVLDAAEEAGIEPNDLIDEVLDLAASNPRVQAAAEGMAEQPRATYGEMKGLLNQARTGQADRLAQAVDPDPSIMASAERLGLDDSIPASAVSRNRAYQETEQALKSDAESGLGVAEDIFTNRLKQEADRVITDFGGVIDRGSLDATTREAFDTTSARISELESAAYDRIRQAIPPTTEVVPQNSEAYVQGMVNEYGKASDTLMNASEKRLQKIIGADGPLNYAALDRLRKDVGAALGAKQGSNPFPNDDVGRLRQLYSVLLDDQQVAANAVGGSAGRDFAEARALTVQRKNLENRMKDLFGSKLDQTLINRMQRGTDALATGDLNQLMKLMQAMPAPLRQEAAATMLNRMFTFGARNQSSLSQGFVGFYERLNRTPRAKDFFFSYLPEDARQRMDDVFAVAKGFYGAKQYENKSKTANTLINNFERGGWLSKLYGVARMTPGVSGVVGDVVNAAAGATSRTKAADKLLRSPKFREALRAAATKNGAKEADDALRTSPAFQEWIMLQAPSIRTTIAEAGAIPYFLSMTEEDGNAQTQ